MKIKIEEKHENSLLKRQDITFLVDHSGTATPSRIDLRAKLAAMLNSKEDQLYIIKLSGLYGQSTSQGYAHLYPTKEAALKQEQAYNRASATVATANQTIPRWRELWHGLSTAKRAAIVIAIVVLSVFTTVSSLPRAFNPLHPAPALASPCVLSILGGSAEFRNVTSDTWIQCSDGMVLKPSTFEII